MHVKRERTSSERKHSIAMFAEEAAGVVLAKPEAVIQAERAPCALKSVTEAQLSWTNSGWFIANGVLPGKVFTHGYGELSTSSDES